MTGCLCYKHKLMKFIMVRPHSLDNWHLLSWSRNLLLLQHSSVRHRVHKSLTLDTILTQFSSIQNFTFCSSKIYFNIILHLRLGLRCNLLTLRFCERSVLDIILSFTLRAMCASHHILDLITVTVWSEEWNYEAPHYVIFSSLMLLPLS